MEGMLEPAPCLRLWGELVSLGVVASGIYCFVLFFFFAQHFIILRACCRDDFPWPSSEWRQGLNDRDMELISKVELWHSLHLSLLHPSRRNTGTRRKL